MLALLNWFRPRHTGWSKLATHEGVKVLFPDYPTRKCSISESPLGKINVIHYSGKLQETTFSTILSIRDYQPSIQAEAEDYFQDWKDEFKRSMQVCNIEMFLIKESMVQGKAPRCNLLFTNADETVYTRVSLLCEGTRLVILFACGMLQEISGPACSECFRSIRL
ncbi:MAG TPA: hypothetical protein PLN21_13760 [Gemmatales bacterium]|nr:hypothetical protein [Gemmatales bacterium]